MNNKKYISKLRSFFYHDIKDLKNIKKFLHKNQKLMFGFNHRFHPAVIAAKKLINSKKLGVAIVVNKKKETVGIFTDGDIKRTLQKNQNLKKLIIKSFMTKNPISVDKDVLAAKAVGIMNEKKITSLCVHSKLNKKKTIGIIHIHNLISADIS